MEKTYVIGWRSKSEPRWGQGKKLLTREEAQALAAEMNQDYPAFVHEPLNLTASEPLESPIVHVDFGTTPAVSEETREVVMA
jgi:hypothetical protein